MKILKIIIINILYIFMSNIYCSNIQNIDTDKFNYDNLSTLPILHEGRIKPLDSFARITLKSISNKESINNKSATQWLLDLIFNPKQDYDNKIFIINNEEVKNILNLQNNVSNNHLFSFKQILPGIKQNINLVSKIESRYKSKDKNKSLSKTDKELLNVYHKTLNYFDLSRTLSLLLPNFNKSILSESFKLNIKNNNDNISYYDLRDYQQSITESITKTINKELKNPSSRQQEILSIARTFKDTANDRINISLKIIPSNNYKNNNWLSPWEILSLDKHNNQENIKYLNLLQKIVYSYYDNNTDSFDKFSLELTDYSINNIKIIYSSIDLLPKASINQSNLLKNQLITEIYYNKLKLFDKTIILYILSFILAICFIFQKNKIKLFKSKKLLYLPSVIFILGFLCHITSLIMRVYILQRPPVSNLYESILFVSLITAMMAFFIEKLRKDNIGVLLGSIISIVLLFIASSYAQAGDTLGVLIAVLNNNFWLGTHVVAITSGYGFCLILSALSHIYLLKQCINHKEYNKPDNLLKYILAFALLALFFTLLGTILGGIWADQSWGRFWGWDPKENGALLICLWLTAILHGRIANHFSSLTFVTLSAATSITVMLAWFGVNLLNTGLHSYGFTENIALNLFLFIVFEVILISGLWIIANRHNKKLKLKQI